MLLHSLLRAAMPITMAALVALAGGCDEGLAPHESQTQLEQGNKRPPPAPAAPARHLDPVTGVSFPLPGGLDLETDHSLAGGAAGEVRHTFTLSQGKLERLTVEVWYNPALLPLDDWFKEHLAFMRDGHALFSWTPLSASQQRGMEIRRPRTGQAFGQRIAVFALADRIFRVTCQNQDNPAALAAYKLVTSSLSIGARR